MSRSKVWYDFLNLAVCLKGQAGRLGIEHEGVPAEGVVVRLTEAAIQARAALDSVRALHAKHENTLHTELKFVCSHRHCIDDAGDQCAWPCPTIQAIETKETKA